MDIRKVGEFVWNCIQYTKYPAEVGHLMPALTHDCSEIRLAFTDGSRFVITIKQVK